MRLRFALTVTLDMQPLEPDPRILAAAMSANVLCPLRRVRLERPFAQCSIGVQTFAQVCTGTRLRCGELVVVSNQLRATTAPDGDQAEQPGNGLCPQQVRGSEDSCRERRAKGERLTPVTLFLTTEKRCPQHALVQQSVRKSLRRGNTPLLDIPSVRPDLADGHVAINVERPFEDHERVRAGVSIFLRFTRIFVDDA